MLHHQLARRSEAKQASGSGGSSLGDQTSSCESVLTQYILKTLPAVERTSCCVIDSVDLLFFIPFSGIESSAVIHVGVGYCFM